MLKEKKPAHSNGIGDPQHRQINDVGKTLEEMTIQANDDLNDERKEKFEINQTRWIRHRECKLSHIEKELLSKKTIGNCSTTLPNMHQY